MSAPGQLEKLQKFILAVTGNRRSVSKPKTLLRALEGIHVSRVQSAIVKALHVHVKQEGKIRPQHQYGTMGPLEEWGLSWKAMY